MSPRSRRGGKAVPPARPGGNVPSPDPDRCGRAAERLAFVTQRAGIVDPDEAALALERRRAQLAAQAAPPRVRVAPREAPSGAADLWVPIGPTVVLGGQAGGRPRVAGRVRDLRVSDDGLRAYAATANGGVWYSPDGGETWSPLGGWGVSGTPPNVTVPSNVLVCGCIYVRFDTGGNAANDEVLVGTGELLPQLLTTPLQQSSLQGWPGGTASSVGVIRAVGPAGAAEFAQVWNVEGTNLAGRGIYRLVGNPDESPPTTFVAATSAGAWTRTGGPTAVWSPVPAAPFNTGPGGALICTDAAWSKGQGATPTRLWIAVRDDVGGSSGLFLSTNGTAGPFTPVALPGLAAGSRISISVAPSNPAVVYALADGDRVWRIDGVAVKPVTRIPTQLLRGQDFYDQAIAVHPTHPEKLVLGGATAKSDGEWSAALYMANVTGPTAGNYLFGFTTPAASNPTADNSYIGNGVHADVHVARFVPVPGKTELWIGCDGGVFRSQQGDATNRQMKNSFVPRNTGIAVLEPGYTATHPTVDGYVLAGAQDNGTLERVGDTVWRGRFLGDGGGIAFDPAAPHRFVRQYIQGQWNSDGSVAFTSPVLRTTGGATGATPTEASEHGNATFYTGTDAVLVGPGSARLAFGTYRVWYSSDWGQTWATLPSLTDPMALSPPPAAQNANTDAILTVPGGAPLIPDSQVVAVRWASPTRLYVLCRRIVLRYDFVADATVPGGFRVTTTVLSRQAPGKCEDPQAAATVASPGQVLPAVGEWSDLAVHDPTRGPHGSFYVAATGHPATPTMDTLWWFDGTDRWHATKLRTDATHGVPAPAYSVAVHPTDPTIVFVGTSVGVWKGILTIGDPKWDWHVYCNGLPEATVQDLATVNTGGVRLLRAGVQARGVWEVDLQGPGTAQTYLRIHQWDTRRPAATALVDPTKPAAAPALSWHASPDIRVRPRRGSVPPRPTGLPWIGSSSDPYGLWVFQTALHGKPDLVCKPDGKWTPLFDACLRAATSGGNRVTQAIWNTVVGSGASFPNAYADPWNSTFPTEADLIELIRDLPAPALSPASMGIRAGAARVDVLVHHRHLTPAPAAGVKVTLLRRDVSGTNAAAWAALASGWTAAVQTFVRSGGAVPALPAGWAFADTGTPVRSPDGPVDARLPRAVTFDTDFTGLAAGTRVLLVAVAHSGVDQVTLPSPALQTLALGTRFVAVRSVEIV
jgi:hypothetical protein